MLLIRLYIALLAAVFLVLSLVEQRLGILEATVVTCALIFLILDTRQDLLFYKKIERQIDTLLDEI